MATCSSCGKHIEPEAEVCPYCEAPVSRGFNATPWIMLAIVIYVIAEIFAGRSVGVAPAEKTNKEVVK